MGFFYNVEHKQKRGKEYIVLTPIHNPLLINLVLLLIPLSAIYFPALYKRVLHEYARTIIWIIFGVFAFGILLQSIDQFRVYIARLQNKKVTVKGGATIFNVKNPQQTWIEQ